MLHKICHRSTTHWAICLARLVLEHLPDWHSDINGAMKIYWVESTITNEFWSRWFVCGTCAHTSSEQGPSWKKCLTPITVALFMSDQPNIYVRIKMIPWELFSHQKLISVTNGWNSKKKIREAYFHKKIFEITIIRLTMAEIKTILYYPGFYSSLRYQN